jgi:cell division protein FtsI/penicillin-binding protein 2
MSLRKRKKVFDDLRITVLIMGQSFVAFIFIARLFQIQVLNHKKYSAMAQEQYWTLQEMPAKRGDVVSSDGFPLATTQPAFLLYGEPNNVEDPLQLAHDLATVVIRYKKDFYEDTAQEEALLESYKNRYYEVLGLDLKWAALEHYLPLEAKEEILALNSVGVGFEEEPRRFYPEGTLASHILGFVAKNEKGEEQGYFGIEGSLDGDLKGKPGRVIEERDATGAPILVGGYTKVNSIDGRKVVLTINRALQYLVEKKLEEGVKRYGAASGSVIVMDPFSGDILAMANYPTYHPARFNEDIYNDLSLTETEITEEEEEIEENSEESEGLSYGVERKNFAISKTYEPGSVLKPFTVAAGIDIGRIKPETTFEDYGPVIYSGHTIDNWDGKHHNVQTIVQLLQKSNNVGAAWVGHQVGRKQLHKYFNSFGFGSRTSIDLEGEDTGIIRPHKEWTDIDLATIAFGQGISATPLQVLSALNSLANGGNLMRPRIVDRFIEGGTVIEIPVEEVKRVVSEESSDTMVYMLTEAVSGGESKYFNIKDYKIAGKTGTAQIPVGGKYDPELTNATFMGFPATTKKFTMIVRLEKPSTSVYAAETAVPLWMSIAEDLIMYFGIAPDLE